MASIINAATSGGLISTGDTSGQLQLQTAGTTALTIDSSQNLGVGVTPSSWATYKAIDILGYASFSSYNGNEADMSTNAYYNAGWKYKNTAAATLYQQDTGVHRWQYAASGTAGNAITWTAGMTLDTSGRLGLGTSSPTTSIYINGAPSTASITIQRSDEGGYGGRVGCGNTLYGPGAARSLGLDGYAGISFGVNGSESMRLNNSSQFIIGSTTGNGTGITLFANGGSPQIVMNASTTTNTDMYFQYASNTIGSISTTTTTTSYNITSDYRLKENIVPITGALAKVAQLKPVTYNWKSAPDEISEGFIAHELAEVCPQAVTGTKDAVDEDGKPVYQGIDTSHLIATLTAAIQELSTQVTELKAEVQALKGA
jgi:hypothetical protein